MDTIKPQINQLNTCHGPLPMTNEFNLKCTNGYEISNLRLEGNDILFECDEKNVWRDIKDAPRDGTIILAHVHDEFEEGYTKIQFINNCWSWNGDTWLESSINAWVPVCLKNHHYCSNFFSTLVCKEITGQLHLIHDKFEFTVDFCPFCGFTLKK